MEHWFNENYELLKTICKKACGIDDVDDLLHSVIEQILNNEKFKEIEDDKQRLYFITRVITNNYRSRSSPYFYEFGRHRFLEISGNDCGTYGKSVERYEDEEEINLDWVENEIKKLKNSNEWYYGRLFEMYIDLGCSITKLSQKTTIPINSVSRDINKVRKMLRKKRDKML